MLRNDQHGEGLADSLGEFKMILRVYDAILLEITENRIQEAKQLISEVMQGMPSKFTVPLVANVREGRDGESAWNSASFVVASNNHVSRTDHWITTLFSSPPSTISIL
jgi:hypothetical protein